jgi:branched-chain amino acid transport system permease protein
MSDFYAAYRPLIDLFLLHVGYAFSQAIVLRAGVFSVATAGLAAIGAYAAAILGVSYHLNPWLAILASCAAGTIVALILSWPLARLRGVYQAIATLAFVQIVASLNLYAEPLTGGAMGFNNIPRLVDTSALLLAVAVLVYLMFAIGSTRIGRAFEAIRQDEAMASSLGVSVTSYQALAFALSGAMAGLFGGLEAFHSYALEPNQFGFPLLVVILSYVVLGGRRSTIGPIVGTAFLIAILEIARPLAENRILVYGVLLVLIINYLPRGLADSLIETMRRRRMTRLQAAVAEGAQ